jgi:multiple sugar transport system substrate-binding protein
MQTFSNDKEKLGMMIRCRKRSFHKFIVLVTLLWLTLCVLSGCEMGTQSNGKEASAKRVITEDKLHSVLTTEEPPPKVFGVELKDLNAGGTLRKQYTGQTLRVGTKVEELRSGLEAAIPYFEKASGAKVELTSLPDETFIADIEKDLSQVHRFDAVLVPGSFAHSYAQSGYLKELSPYTQDKAIASPNLDLDDFIPNLLDIYGYYKGKLYAFPYKPDAQILFYRKDLFEDQHNRQTFQHQMGRELKVPETVEELYETARFFTRSYRTDSTVRYGFNLMGKADWSRWTFTNRLGAYGGKDVDKDFKPGFHNEAGVQTMKTYVELAKYVPPDYTSYGWTEANRKFIEGDVAMMEQWPGLSRAAEAPDSLIRGKVGYAVVPGVGSIQSPTMGAWTIAVVNNPHRPESSELAYKFAEYVTSKDIELLKIRTGNDPTRSSNYRRPEVAAANPIYPVLAESFSKAKVLADPDVPFVTSELNKVQDAAVQSVIHGAATPGQAIDKMAAQFEQIISGAGLYE